MYKAKVIQIRQIEKHPNADRLQVVKFNGLQFVVDLSFSEGDTVILFPSDGALSHEFAYITNLYRDSIKNNDKTVSGFFEDNRRVRAQPFRKVKSDGLVCHKSALTPFAKSQKDFDIIQEGYEFDTFCGHLICEKYVTEATRIAMNRKVRSQKSESVTYHLPKHFDTAQLDYNFDKFPNQGIVIITEKMHGTSGRTGYVQVEREKETLVGRAINSLFKRRIIQPRVTVDYERISGTRNTIVNTRPDCTVPSGSEYFRWEVHNQIAPLLYKGETVYYEIVGYDHFGGPIMSPQSLDRVKDSSLLGVWKDRLIFTHNMVYSYGCKCVHGNGLTPNFDVYVYRITQQGHDGNVVELPWFSVQRRCKEMGLKTVPVLGLIMLDWLDEQGMKLMLDYVKGAVADKLVDSPSTLDNRHLMEGVCVRVESALGMEVFKAKNWMFKLLEQIVKEDDKTVDLEEAS